MNRRSFLKRIAAFGLALALPAGLEGQAATSDPAEVVWYIVDVEEIPLADHVTEIRILSAHAVYSDGTMERM